MSNREIKFRLWDTELNEFVDTNLMDVALTFEGRPILLGDCGGYCNYTQGIIQQYTGILDKNKKEIFEGDIVKYKMKYGDYEDEQFDEVIEKVYFSDGAYYPIPTDYYCGDDESNSYKMYSFEVIGNIFENPDLIPA